jgi:HAMP domain-containing protein
MWRGRGLLWKFNATLLPVVAAMALLLGWLDARHERTVVAAAHAMHNPEAQVGVARAAEAATNPDAVARRSVAMHAVYAGALLVVIGLGVNLALSRFVLQPLDRIRDGIEKMERGHWRMPHQPAAHDEVGRLVESFQQLGLTVDALVRQLLGAERLAAVALVARTTAAQVEPRVERIAAAASHLQQQRDARVREAAHEIAVASAQILAAVKGLDQLFDPSLRNAGQGPGGATRAAAAQRGGVATAERSVECGADTP